MNPLMNAMGGPVGNMAAMMQTVNSLKGMLRGQNPDAVLQMLAKSNPQFAGFLRENSGKSPRQIAQDYGLDWDMVQSLMK